MLYQLFWIFMGHILGDVILQMNILSKIKRKSLWALSLHVFIWSGIISVILYYFNLFTLWKLLFLFFSHFLIDWIKGSKFKQSPGDLKKLTLVDIIDQFLHLISLLLVIFL